MPEILPNCLTRTPRADTSLLGYWYVYCANCGDDIMRVRDTDMPAQFAFALCNDCVEKYGEPAGFGKIPDEVFWEKCCAAMQEEYGHVLTDPEISRELEDPSSTISKLEREAQRR